MLVSCGMRVHLVTRAFTNCSDAVRSLVVMPGSRFLSASDDGSIRLWALDGKLESTMVGHTSIVYSVDGNVSGVSIVSGSKDCFAKIWKGRSFNQNKLQHYLFRKGNMVSNDQEASAATQPELNTVNIPKAAPATQPPPDFITVDVRERPPRYNDRPTDPDCFDDYCDFPYSAVVQHFLFLVCGLLVAGGITELICHYYL